VRGTVQHVLAEDVGGDGRRDLLVFSVVPAGPAETERLVTWFHAGAAGFDPVPAQTWRFDPEGSFVDVARRPEGGLDMVYCVPGGLRRYRLVRGMRDPPRAEPYWTGVGLLAGRSADAFLFYDFLRDWRGRGVETAAVLQPGKLVLLDRDPAAPPLVLSLRTEIERLESPASVQFRPRSPTYLGQRLPNLDLADWDGDGHPDLIATIGDRVEVHLAHAGGELAAEPDVVARLLGPGDPRDETRRQIVQVADVNGDGKLDAVVSTLSGGISDAQHVVQVFLGTGGGFASRPSASLELRGAAAQVILSDLDGDGRDELTVASMTVGIPALLRLLVTRRATIGYATYEVGRDGGLGKRPSLAWSRSIPINLRGTTDPPALTLTGDFDGDGVRDLVSSPRDGQLEVRRIVRGPGGLALGDVLDVLSVPAHAQVVAADLEHRGRSDLIVYDPRSHEPEGRVLVFRSR
jgi:hypothetical protein